MRPQPGGFMIFDAMMALFILGILMTLMAVGLSSHQRTAGQLKNTRDACNAAETALTELQRGKPLPATEPATKLHVDRLTGGTPVPQFTWVRITAVASGRTASLIGLVQTDALGGK